MFKKVKCKLILSTIVLSCVTFSYAQCAMCRAVLETEQGQGAAEGINNGIVYLMIIPYILVFGVGYIIYKKFNNAESQST